MIAELLIFLSATKPVPAHLEDSLDRWEGLIPEVTLKALDCGYENAFYYPAAKTVVMCTELFDRPDLARGILQHELAHAFLDQNGLRQSEFSADELGFMVM